MDRTIAIATCALLCATGAAAQPAAARSNPRPTQREMVERILGATRPLEHGRGDRLPLYLWPLNGLGTDDEAEALRLLRELDRRGLAAIATWHPARREASLRDALFLGRLQARLGLQIVVNANACLHHFFDGDERTAHVDNDGRPFFDRSFDPKRPMGCPFALDHRRAPIRAQLEPFLDAYRGAGLTPGFVFVDWEIDGPIEWNDAWAHSKRCRRCREHVPGLDEFAMFQRALREVRCRLQRECLAEPVLNRFPGTLVGNYAVYPNDGWRYWYDYFETLPADAPSRADARARVRPWVQEFPLTGHTVAMPVVYTWYPTFGWYDFDETDYRWFYNLLQIVSSSGRATPARVPSVPFVHWHTTAPPPAPDPEVRQFSAGRYQELLWHALLRGHDSFFLWCPRDEAAEEARLVHEVWAASLEHAEFLTRGTPLRFDVPARPGPVVSAVRLGSRVLVRRTDFDRRTGPVRIEIDGGAVDVPRVEGRCQVLELLGAGRRPGRLTP